MDEALARKLKNGTFSQEIVDTISQFLPTYLGAFVEERRNPEEGISLMRQYLDLLEEQLLHPYAFPPYHAAIREPFDYYRFGLDFFAPLIDPVTSQVHGKEQERKIAHYLEREENVILFANHQTEPDPQLIALLLEKTGSSLGERMIFVAGHRVTSDPLAVPFSLGCHLLSIYSKKYIDSPAEKKAEKISHNQKTLKAMGDLLNRGGALIYVAPSGGRDRPDSSGHIPVAPFDPQSTEMFYLMAQHANKPTHFFPLALWTYDILPPPNHVAITLGEPRKAGRATIHLCFGSEIAMEFDSTLSGLEKKEKRLARAERIWQLVKENYRKISPRGDG